MLGAANVELIDWPGNSPDLSLIENVWAEVERRLWRGPPWGSQQEFEQSIVKYWNQVSKDGAYLRKLWISMPKRVAECIAAAGGYTSL